MERCLEACCLNEALRKFVFGSKRMETFNNDDKNVLGATNLFTHVFVK
jgi:hypothetical protein